MPPVRSWASGRFGTAEPVWQPCATGYYRSRASQAGSRWLYEHRIRRLDTERVLGILRQPAITVAEAVTEAAVLHLRSLVARLRLANREFHQAEHKLDELCAGLRESTAAAVLSLRPAHGAMRQSCVRCPGSARSPWRHCSPRRPGQSAGGTMPPSGPFLVWLL